MRRGERSSALRYLCGPRGVARRRAPGLRHPPSLHPSIGKRVTRKVDKLSCIRFGSARYSVPMTLIGRLVEMEVAGVRLRAHLGTTRAEHALVAPGETSVKDEHYGARDHILAAPHDRARLSSGTFSGSAPPPTCSSSGRSPPARPPSDPSFPSSCASTEGPPSGKTTLSLPLSGRSPSGAGASATCAASWGLERASPPRLRHKTPSLPPCLPRPPSHCEPTRPMSTDAAGGSQAGLKRLKLTAMRTLAPELLVVAKTQRWKPEEFLRALVEAEIAARDASNARNRLRVAKFPVTKSLDEFDVAPSSAQRAGFDYLALLEWIAARENPCLWSRRDGKVAPACRARPRSRPGRPPRALLLCRLAGRDPLSEMAHNSVGKVIDQTLRADFVIVDELGFAPLDDAGTQLLFRFVATVYNGCHSVWPAPGPSTSGDASFPDQPPRSAFSTACCATASSSSPTASRSACVEARQRGGPRKSYRSARGGVLLGQSRDINLAIDTATGRRPNPAAVMAAPQPPRGQQVEPQGPAHDPPEMIPTATTSTTPSITTPKARAPNAATSGPGTRATAATRTARQTARRCHRVGPDGRDRRRPSPGQSSSNHRFALSRSPPSGGLRRLDLPCASGRRHSDILKDRNSAAAAWI